MELNIRTGNKMRKLKKALILVASSVILLLFAGYFMQKKLIFLPTKLPQDYTYEFNIPFEEFFIESKDGARLNALHFRVNEPKGVILYFHGNAGDLSRWGEIATYFTQFNYDVVVMDYRTYGKSTGVITEKSLYQDAQLFYNYVAENNDSKNIVVYGRSLGTSLATYIASKNQVGKLILETPFYNLTEVAKKRVPILPVKHLLKFKFPTNKFIKHVNAPVLIIHGTNDSIVPYTSGEKLAKLVSSDRLTFIKVPGGEHNDLINFDVYQLAIANTLK